MVNPNGQNHLIGDVGEHLVMAHLKSNKIEAGIISGNHGDIIAYIGNVWRKFQVKTSSDKRYFMSGGHWHTNGSAEKKTFSEYDVDAFAFCFLPDPYPYYIAIEAMINDSISFPKNAFTRSMRDLTFNELLKRWNCYEGSHEIFKNFGDSA